MMLATPQRSRTPKGAAYLEKGAGEPLLLIHGVGMQLEAWGPQISALSDTHRVIAVDMPGHGGSERIAPDARLDGFVAWLSATIDDLGLDSLNVAGHSMGALIAGGIAATQPHRIRRVALLNSVYRRSPDARAAVRARAAEILKGGHTDYDGPLLRWFGEDNQHSEAYRLTRSWLSDVDPKGYATAYSAFAEGDAFYADCWPSVQCPALFLTGADDPNSTPAMAIAMADAAPRGYFRLIENERHMVNLTAPVAVNAIMREWLAREAP
ncbi:pimeloyl-ACP methyl ester carboxylesterase [Phyllobacterium brassicacearum]|nr:pimeloyl-ACP methyl ester carboxylesterase [Phyllobacterium brassicacearum]